MTNNTIEYDTVPGLADHRYILHEDKSYCKHCYEHLYANICDKCKTPITCEYKVVQVLRVYIISK